MTQLLEKVDASKVSVGDLMAFTYWGIVERTESTVVDGKRIVLTDVDSGVRFAVDGEELIRGSNSSDQVFESKRVSKTAIVEILANSVNVPFTVTYLKKDGSKRVLRGRLIGIDRKNLGYIDVEDLDIKTGNRFRLVDCRTIQHLIVGGVKYSV